MTDVVLETERLTLRRLAMSDLDAVVELDSDPEVMSYISGGAPTPRDELAAKLQRWVADPAGFGRMAAIARHSGRFVGWFGLRPTASDRIVGLAPGDLELGYRLRRAEWGKGYATEGSLALIRKAFAELPVARIIATTMTVNLRSRRVMEKAGLSHVSTFHLDWDDPIEGTEQGDVLYAVTRAQWSAR